MAARGVKVHKGGADWPAFFSGNGSLTSSVRFEDEADEEYRAAARRYEGRRRGLGAEFLDAVDVALSQIV
jgi:hypothetical protein